MKHQLKQIELLQKLTKQKGTSKHNKELKQIARLTISRKERKRNQRTSHIKLINSLLDYRQVQNFSTIQPEYNYLHHLQILSKHLNNRKNFYSLQKLIQN